MDKSLMASRTWVKIIRYLGRGLLILWAGFWAYFAFASALSEAYPDPGTNALGWVIVIVGTLLLVGGAIVPWIWERLGGFILLGIGLFLMVFFLVSSGFKINLWMLLVFLPAFLTGGISLVCWFADRKFKPAL
ncbi:hypothetical protein GX441_06370 [bacterium]|nr:hypothetical protein [bacterium]